jgi:hypothetical protein
MKDYESISKHVEPNEEVVPLIGEGDPLIKFRLPVSNRPWSNSRHLVGGIVALCFLGLGVHHLEVRPPSDH